MQFIICAVFVAIFKNTIMWVYKRMNLIDVKSNNSAQKSYFNRKRGRVF